MAFVVERIQFALNASTGPQSVPLTQFASETPKAVIMFTSGMIAPGDVNEIARSSIGFGTANGLVVTGQSCNARFTDHNIDLTAGTTNARRYRNDARILHTMNSPNGSNRESVSLLGFGSNTLELDVVNANTAILINAVILGGDDLTNALAVDWPMNTSATADPNTPTLTGFQPNCGLVATTGQTNNGNATNTILNLSFWDQDTNQFTIGATSRDNRSGAQVSEERRYNDDLAIVHRSQTGAGNGQATLDSWAPAGFNLTWIEGAPSSTRRMYGLFLAGVPNLAARDVSPSSPSTNQPATTFPPSLVLYASNSVETWPQNATGAVTNGNSAMSFGIADGSTNTVDGSNSLDNQSVTQQSRSTLDNAHSLIMYADGDMSVEESATTNFVGNRVDTVFDAATSSTRHYILLAMGASGAPPTLNPSATGSFSGATSGDVTRDIPPTLNPSVTGTFSGRTTGNALRVLQPTATGTFSGRTSGNVTRAGLLNPSATGSFSGRTSGDVTSVGKVNPSATGSFSGATLGDVLVALRPSAVGQFSGRTSGSITIPPKASVCRRVAVVPREDRTAKV